jgi:hypothetical protein
MAGGTLIASAGSPVLVQPRATVPPSLNSKYRGLYGGDLELSKRNLFVPAALGGIVGPPAANARSLLMSGTAGCVDSAVAEADNMTWFVVLKTAATFLSGAQPGFMGNIITATSGVALYIAGTSTAAPAGNIRAGGIYSVAGVPTLKVASMTIADLSAYNLLAVVFEAGVGVRIYNLTTNQAVASVAATDARIKNAASTIRVGSSLNLGGTATNEIALSDIHHEAFSENRINEIGAKIRLQMAARGITV